MQDSSSLATIFECPVCRRGTVHIRGERCPCAACGRLFPLIDGIPWLYVDPEATLAEWRLRLHRLLVELRREASETRAALEHSGPGVAVRSRLKLQAGAYEDHERRVAALLAPLGVDTLAVASEWHDALATRAPRGPGLAAYYANVHRDWLWGDAENEATFAQVSSALGEHVAGRILVLGAGAGRLAHDLAGRRPNEIVVALDVNPLLAIVGRRVMAGERVSLYEFPIAPIDADSFALLRTLTTTTTPGATVQWVLADARDAPFPPASFDTIVTPWLIDVVDDDFAAFAKRVNALLRDGGRWINTGSLVFSNPDRALRYTLGEVRELVSGAGFDTPAVTETQMPYMASPASRHSRRESVVTFGATKLRAVAAPARTRVPQWLERHDLPIPSLPAFQSDALSMRIYGYLATLIDGRRSIRDIAQELVRERLLTPDLAEAAVRGFVGRLYEDSLRRPQL